MNKNKDISAYLKPGTHVHLVGIGGVSMRPLGLVLKGMGMTVSGSDMSSSVSPPPGPPGSLYSSGPRPGAKL